MKYTPTALIPGILAGILVIIVLTGMITSPQAVEASAPANSPQNEPKSANGCLLPKSYPESIQRWCSWIQDYASQHNLDPALIAAVMLQESGGNPQAYSNSGAVGLMQVMPRDGIAASFMCPNGPCFASRPSMDELFDPEFNISYGINMLAGLINKYGSERDALKAYGPMNVGYYYADIVMGIYSSYQ
jgi:soluble lytic murein transglycosylase-like protein